MTRYTRAFETTPEPSTILVATDLGRLTTVLGSFEEPKHTSQWRSKSMKGVRAPYWIAITLLDLCDLLAERGQPTDLERLVNRTERAINIAREYGCAGLIERGAPATHCRLWCGGLERTRRFTW